MSGFRHHRIDDRAVRLHLPTAASWASIERRGECESRAATAWAIPRTRPPSDIDPENGAENTEARLYGRCVVSVRQDARLRFGLSPRFVCTTLKIGAGNQRASSRETRL
jgi:hypothetical protein